MAWATYRSFRLGLLSILPLTITMSICFGLMGIFNLPISLPTAVIANIVIGCGIDYSFHFLSRFKNESRNHTSTNDAIYATVNGVGKPILYNALSVALGFSTLMFSMFLPLQFLGGLIALAMLTCGICSLTSLASSISLGSKKIIS
ncbi:MAG TPA: hypothetical protein DC049_13255 [Spirochaetia bacterium]|nr:hypothetical protein [Spirochaetia bacterium]